MLTTDVPFIGSRTAACALHPLPMCRLFVMVVFVSVATPPPAPNCGSKPNGRPVACPPTNGPGSGNENCPRKTAPPAWLSALVPFAVSGMLICMVPPLPDAPGGVADGSGGSLLLRTQAAPGVPTGTFAAIDVPFISHTVTVPSLVFCHRRSALPSPLTSLVPTSRHTGGGATSVVVLTTDVPFIIQMVGALVLVLSQRMSASPLPAKSPVPMISMFAGCGVSPTALMIEV